MSDLEPSSSRAQSAAPITQLATGKLRALSANSSPFAETDGLIDAFAEVFARMAVAAPPAVQTDNAPRDETNQEVAADDVAESTTADSTSQNEGESSSRGDEIDTDPIQLLDKSTETDVSADDIDVDFEATERRTDNESIDESITDDVAIEPLLVRPQSESEQAETVELVDDAPEIVAPVAVVADPGTQRRQRRDSQQVQTSGEPELTHVRGESESRTDRTGPRDVEAEQPLAEIRGDSDAASDDNQRGRARRSRRGDRTPAINEDQTQPFAEQTRTSRQGNTAPIKPVTTEWAGDATYAQDAPKPQAARTPAAVTAAANAIAAQVTGSAGTPSPAASTVRGVANQSTQPIDPSASTAKTQPKPKTNGNESTGPTSDLVSRAKLIQRVSKAFQHLGADGGHVRIRLAPPDLGTVRVEMRIQQRKIQARVVAESEAASNALREHLPDLRARLEAQGMQIDKIEIETETGSNGEGQLGDADTRGDARQQQSFGRPQRQSDPAIVSQSVSQHAAPSLPDFVNRSTVGVDVRL